MNWRSCWSRCWFGVISHHTKFTGDGKINWNTVGAAMISGAAVGATGGRATTVALKVGLTGAEKAAAIAIPSAGVAHVEGANTQIVITLKMRHPWRECTKQEPQVQQAQL